MSPIGFIALLIGVPALFLLGYVFIRGSTGLRRYILTRIVLTLPMVLILGSLVFLIMRVVPGDPVRSALGPKGTPEMIQQIRTQLGLNDPMYVQYGRYLVQLFTLHFGNSLVGAHRPIADEMSERFPATLELIIPASILALVIGIFGGAHAAAHRKGVADYGWRIYAVIIYSLPIFWLGLMLQLLFGVKLHILPISGRIDPVIGTTLTHITNIYTIDSIITGNWLALKSVLQHLVLPTITLGLILSGIFVRLTRINVIETLSMDYISAARARGIRERVLVYGHALKNALIPIITLIGLQIAILLAGAVLTETVFSWPGMGSYLVERISQRDYTAVQSTIAVFALLVAMISLAVDVIYSLVDPRVRY
ncbi:MAG: peptide ABC transporter permease [Anaerolineales bacterium]|nr:ABC transporter permease [Anaerolineae bacterium]PWB49476.1 MAG: peptide ABC transporter permease [Anaerolineales bacterium]